MCGYCIHGTLPAMKMTHRGGRGGGMLACVAGLAQHVVVVACML